MALGPVAVAAPLMLLLVSADLDRDTEKQFEKIADSVTMIGTCQQHDFSVDVAGIDGWKSTALDLAVAEGMSREDAQALLEEEITDELGRVQEKFVNAQQMAHSPDHVARFNRSMRRSCERLAKDEFAGQYFSESD